jgi:23S rRNA pseudouridine2605 synthase
MKERVQKLIARSGFCSRRKAEDYIAEGKVFVNDKKITLGDKAEFSDKIVVDGKKLVPEKLVYYMLNKPKHYITTSKDLFNRKKVVDLLPSKPRVYSVGRLDRDTTGLLLFTNDGDFAQKVSHPRNNISKTYIATLDRPFSNSDISSFEKGIVLDKRKIVSKVIVLEPKIIAITLHVGIHKVVKRLLKSKGYYVKRLHRTHIGSLALDIDERTFRELSKEDLKLVFQEPTITKETFM